MAQNERRRHLALARKKAKQKVRRKNRLVEQRAATAYDGESKGVIRSAPIHECLCAKKIGDMGIGNVIISRKLDTGRIALGVFLVDIYCLGIREAAFALVPTVAQYDEIVGNAKRLFKMKKAEPAYVRKLVEGAAEYAQSFGFPPHKNYEKATVIFGDIDASTYTKKIEFGKKGKPCYLRAENEPSANVARIIASLKAVCGPDGYEEVVISDQFLEKASEGDDEPDEDEKKDAKAAAEAKKVEPAATTSTDQTARLPEAAKPKGLRGLFRSFLRK